MRFLFFAVLLSVAVPSLEAQKKPIQTKDHGFAMTLVSFQGHKEKLAEALKKRDMKFLRATPEQFLNSFQASDPKADLKTIDQLPAYIMSLMEVACPTGQGKLSRYMLPSKTVQLDWDRDFEVGERCLVNPNTNRLVLSMSCGNTILFPRSIETPAAPASVKQQTFLWDSLARMTERALSAENLNKMILSQKETVEIHAVDSVWVQVPGFTRTYNRSTSDDVGRTTFKVEIRKSPTITQKSSGVSKKVLLFTNLLSLGGGFAGGWYASDQSVRQTVLINGTTKSASPRLGISITLRP